MLIRGGASLSTQPASTDLQANCAIAPPVCSALRVEWRAAVVGERGRVERIPYELCVLQALRDVLGELLKDSYMEKSGPHVVDGPFHVDEGCKMRACKMSTI